jgi:hypothetical protein
MKPILVVSGFIKTGSSALIDLLIESRSVRAVLPEMKILTGQYGIADIARACGAESQELRTILARCEERLLEEGKSPTTFYLKLRRVRSRLFKSMGASRFNRYGYDAALSGEYLRLTRRYFRTLNTRLLPSEDPEICYRYFREATSDYFSALASAASSHPLQIALFNQTIKPGLSTSLGLELIEKAQLIVVDRDPRDQYVELLNRRRIQPIIDRFGENTGDPVADFIRWYRRRRTEFYGGSAVRDSRVLVLRFEDIACEPTSALSMVDDFMGPALRSHVGEIKPIARSFDRARALDAVGIFRGHEDSRAIQRIAESLPEFCYAR